MRAEAAEVADSVLCGEIIELLRQATGEDADWVAGLGPETRLDGDLFLDSSAIAALADSLQTRYGDGVDLVAYIAELDIDQIIELSVADVADHVAARSPAGHG